MPETADRAPRSRPRVQPTRSESFDATPAAAHLCSTRWRAWSAHARASPRSGDDPSSALLAYRHDGRLPRYDRRTVGMCWSSASAPHRLFGDLVPSRATAPCRTSSAPRALIPAGKRRSCAYLRPIAVSPAPARTPSPWAGPHPRTTDRPGVRLATATNRCSTRRTRSAEPAEHQDPSPSDAAAPVPGPPLRPRMASASKRSGRRRRLRSRRPGGQTRCPEIGALSVPLRSLARGKRLTSTPIHHQGRKIPAQGGLQ